MRARAGMHNARESGVKEVKGKNIKRLYKKVYNKGLKGNGTKMKKVVYMT